MTSPKPGHYAVLTGDIVKSGDLSADRLDDIFGALSAQADAVRRWGGGRVPGLERFRGDGWQFVPPQPKWGLRAALVLRAAVRRLDRKFDTRIAIGLGDARLGRRLAGSGGSAFERSGQRLDALRRPSLMGISTGFEPRVDGLLGGIVRLCDTLAGDWTARQAEIFALLAEPDEPIHEAIAEKLGVTPQSVQKLFSQGGGRALLAAIHAFEGFVAGD